mmetsp:Transcript_17045/g.21565  ORF Transcript_17045/g.21565 Transcript_17045/m.21565 type:complete len:538 (-) Transcript_17045:1184-2797(-)
MEPQPMETQTRNDFVKVVKELILNLFNGDCDENGIAGAGGNDDDEGGNNKDKDKDKDNGKDNVNDNDDTKKKKNDKCEVHVFGSHATGLSLPSSDIDFVVLLPGYEEETNNNNGNSNVISNPDSKKPGDCSGANVSNVNTNTNNNNAKSSEPNKEGGGGGEDGGKKQNIMLTKEQEQKEMNEYDVHKHSSKAKNNTNVSPLIRLADELLAKWGGKKNELTYLEVVENTKVPIVKFTHAPTNLSVDICFNQYNGVQNAELVKRFMEAMPPLRPLTFVLKYFLAARGLNEPYTGGIGSFMLQMMIVSFLQQRERYEYNTQAQLSSRDRDGGRSRSRSRNRGRDRDRDDYYYDNLNEYHSPPMNLGSLLVEFFELYGMDFNYLTTAISVRNDGFYFPKGHHTRKEHFFTNPSRAFTLGIENPIDITMDVGKSSFRMQLIQKSFEIALRVLLGHVAEPALRTDSILASILPPTEEMYKRATMYNVLKIEKQLEKQGYHASEHNNNQRRGRGYNNRRNSNSESRFKRRRKNTDSSMDLSESD